MVRSRNIRKQGNDILTLRLEQIPKDHWSVPDWIDMDLFYESAELLKEKGV